MAALPAIVLLLFYFNLVSGYAIVGDEEDELIWPTEYHFNGEDLNLLTTVKKPFEMWYSADRNRSRIDYYGGTTRKYYYGDKKKLYKMYPMVESTDMTSELVCVIKPGKIEAPDFMPKLDGLTFTGETIYLFDKVVDIWTGEKHVKDQKFIEITLYVFKTASNIDIPIQKVIKTYDLEFGELIGHSVTNYYNYRDSVTDKEVSLDDEDDCFYDDELGKDYKPDVKVLHPDEPSDLDTAFDSYINYHNKVYKEKESEMRKRIFEKNWRMVHEHNSKNLSFKLKMNEFSDKTPEELKYLRGTFISKHQMSEVQPFPHTLTEIDDIVEQLPVNFDLRLEGAVTAIKNQGACGSCWAFSTTAAVEGALARSNGDRLIDLSEQSLVDCAWPYGNLGCDGGTLDGALKYVLENGIPTEMEYGIYTEQNGFCNIKNMTTESAIKGFAKVTPLNPNALKVALYKYGPVTVAIHASELMAHYSSGVFYDFTCEDESPNHGVTVVGYGVHEGEDYWLVKNSWGENWGEDGYILMAAKDNNCFLLGTPYYPIV